MTDCKTLGSAYAKPLEEISNRRVQKMFLDVSNVNLVFKHIPGVLNSTTDYRSRHPRDSWEATGEEDSQMRIRLGVRSVKAQEIDLEPVDVRLERMAERAKNDNDYQKMIKYLEEGTPVEEMDKNNELYLMEGERQFMGTFRCSNGYSLGIKNLASEYMDRPFFNGLNNSLYNSPHNSLQNSLHNTPLANHS